MNAIIQDIMRPFGVTPRYAGFPMLVASVELYLEDPNRLSAVIDEIYNPRQNAAAVPPTTWNGTSAPSSSRPGGRTLPSSGKWQAIRSLPTPRSLSLLRSSHGRLRNGKNPPSNPFPFSNPPAHLCRGTFSLSPPRFRRLQVRKSNY